MIDHLGLRTKHFDSLRAFYEAALAPLGIQVATEYEGGVGFGRDGDIALWIDASTKAKSSIHLALRASSRKQVEDFHKEALATGGTDNGGPGLRDYGAGYFAAFVLDPDGNNIEAVFHEAG